MSSKEIRKGLHWVGVQDHELRVFDVIMRTEYGTSYNAYLLKTDEGAVLFETAKAGKFDVFIENLRGACDLEDIKYIVVDHTEPDHVGSLERLMDLAPNATILASAIALRFLSDICNREIRGQAVSDGDAVSVGGFNLRFLSVPFLHWPDSIYTFIEELNTLVTCDSFGCHYADDKVCNDLIKGDFTDAYKYYFDMIMGPFKSYVRIALKKIAPLELDTICPGHGPVLRENLDRYIGMYEEWSREPEPERRSKPKVT
ncbi:MAG: MBL fold metallo-hydrolase, partial [Victivallales bacterium]|nr:MBL fold metallo-hydrolase [Victivallales bacterium]